MTMKQQSNRPIYDLNQNQTPEVSATPVGQQDTPKQIVGLAEFSIVCFPSDYTSNLVSCKQIHCLQVLLFNDVFTGRPFCIG